LIQLISEFLGLLILYLIIIVFLVCVQKLLLDPSSSLPLLDSHENNLLLSKHADTLIKMYPAYYMLSSIALGLKLPHGLQGSLNKLRHVQTHSVFHLFNIITWRLRHLIVFSELHNFSEKLKMNIFLTYF
jgi:hypothetical protein